MVQQSLNLVPQQGCMHMCAQVSDQERAAAVQQLDSEAAVTSLIDGLSFMGGTMEAIQAPVQDPQEWKPEVREESAPGVCTPCCQLHDSVV
jgi:hypothetical protein